MYNDYLIYKTFYPILNYSDMGQDQGSTSKQTLHLQKDSDVS